MMLMRSLLPELRLPNTDFSSFVMATARRLPDKTALLDADTGARLTYRHFTQAVDAAARDLNARGLRRGHVAALCGFNTPDFAVAAHAVWRAGGSVVTMNPVFTVHEMQHQLADAGARYLISPSDETGNSISRAVVERTIEAARFAGVEAVFEIDASGTVEPRATVARDWQPPRRIAEIPEDVALILYSSGTTGLPKGVMLTHRNLIAGALQAESGDVARQDDVLLGIAPFFHAAGLHGVLNAGILVGATVVTMRRHDTVRVVRAVEAHQVSSLFVTPPALHDLVRSSALEEYDHSSLRAVLCAAAPLGAEAEAAAARRLGCVVRQGYGLTEATAPVSNYAADTPVRHGSVGHLVPSTACRIVDLAHGHDLEPGENGEVLIRGPQVMRGYLNRPDETAAVLDRDGWLHTGDVGYADQDGYLYIVDRVKEIIKYKAYQVAPAELEAVLGTHPAVADAAVIPSPAGEVGEIPKALVVLRSAATADELMGFVAERVASYKKIRDVEVVQSIPKSPSGKILRRVLVEQERAALAGVS
jgi:acyl-CoA synthetase (AMP-forming)/AMP-acid ligase II